MTQAIVITGRGTTTVQRRREGDGLVVRQGGRFVILDAEELAEVLAFIHDAPELGRLERFPARTAEAAASDALNFVE